MSDEKKKTGKTAAARRQLTVAQKAEAVALWRAGTVTLEELAKKFGKRTEAFSRLFKRMGVEKGEAAAEAAKKIAEKAEARVLSDTEETLRKIAATRDEHYRMSSALAKVAWSEIVRARQAGTDIANLKDLMTTLKIAGEVIGNARKELFAVLNVEKHDQESDFDSLPELTVRELTGDEILQLQGQSNDEMGLDEDPGAGMLPEDPEEGL